MKNTLWVWGLAIGLGLGCGLNAGKELAFPDGGGPLTIDGAAIEGTIDGRDEDVGSFSPDFPELRGDQYTLVVGNSPVAVGVLALANGNRANIIDFGIEAAPDGNKSLASGHNAALAGMNECRVFPTAGNWTLRVLTYTSLPTQAEIDAGTTHYKVKAQAGTTCNFDSY